MKRLMGAGGNKGNGGFERQEGTSCVKQACAISLLSPKLVPSPSSDSAISNTFVLSNPSVAEKSSHPSCGGETWDTGKQHGLAQGAQDLTAKKDG